MLLCHILQRGTTFVDFLFAFPKDEPLPKRGLLLKERICSYGMGGKNKNKRVACPENVPNNLKANFI